MNNIRELISQSNKYLNMIPKHLRGGNENDLVSLLADCVTALESMQAPLPEDVDKVCKDLRMEWDSQSMSGVYADNLAADMIERLARENEDLHRVLKAQASLLEENRQRLDAPLPEDVAGHIGMLRDNAKIMAGKYDIARGCIDAADMIDRLWREKQGYYSDVKRLELAAENHYAMLDKYRQRIKELKKWQQAKYADKKVLVDRIDELEAALDEIESLGDDQEVVWTAGEGYTNCDKAVEIARKARAGNEPDTP
jgi:hypothetical protein